jgi:uncharacterized protein (TIGR03437 family)
MLHLDLPSRLIRAWLLPAIALLSLSAPLKAQRFSCERQESANEIRLEGTTEIIGDVVLSCTGGRPVTGGAMLPRYNFLVSTNGIFAQRSAQRADRSFESFSDALILINDPDPSRQLACIPGRTPTYCAPSAITRPFPSGSIPNVFSGKLLQSNLMGFSDIPADAPGENKRLIIRITNLRVNAASTGVLPSDITTLVQIFDDNGAPVTITNPQRLAARTRPAVSIAVRTSLGTMIEKPTDAPLSITPQQIPRSGPGTAQSWQIRFTEGFKSAFKRRNIGISSRDPGRIADQSVPGLDYQTESGFNNSLFPADAYLERSGLADSGTRLRLQLDGIPDNVIVWASVREIADGTTNYLADSPKALLTVSNWNGSGPFLSVTDPVLGYGMVITDKGSGQVSWEILSSDPEEIESLTFSIALTSNANPATGTATFRAHIAPLDDGSIRGQSFTPRFDDRSTRGIAFRVAGSIQAPPVTNTSAASFQTGPLAPGSLVAAFGSGFASRLTVATADPVTTLDNVTVEITDSIGVNRQARILFVSPNQINYLMPTGLRAGAAVANIIRSGTNIGSGIINLRATSPALFSANGTGSGPATGAYLSLASADGNPIPIAAYNEAAKSFTPSLIPLTPGDQVYIVLYGTGLRGAPSIESVQATIGGISVPVLYAAAHSVFPGLDQVNLGPIPLSLAGKRNIPLLVTLGSLSSNSVTVSFQ